MRLLRLTLAAALVLVAADAAGNATDLQPKRPGQESFVKRAVFSGGTLWLLSDAGELSSMKEGDDQRQVAVIDQPVLDITRQGTRPISITCDTSACTTWLLYHWENDGWNKDASIASNGDTFLSVNEIADGLLIITSNRLVTITAGQQHSVRLSTSLRAAPVTSVLVTGKNAFIAFDAGEWGGGLQRVDLNTGVVMTIERNATGQLCGGPLNTECDPVNGLALEPWNANCVAAAVGLVHMSPHGRIVEICGDDIRRMYFKAYGEQPSNSANIRSDEPFSTVAFFGLAAGHDSLWATGIDGIYKLDQQGHANIEALPKFKNIGGICVSFAEPDMILVLTDINSRLSVSGSVPMLVPR